MGCLPMAIVGYEEEARMHAATTLLPGAESGGFGQDDIASPVFLAWSKQEKVGSLLEASLASLAFIALRAMDHTSCPIPAKLETLASDIRKFLPQTDSGQVLGPQAAQLETVFRQRVYGVNTP
jgi:histidine ammonia-lyase